MQSVNFAQLGEKPVERRLAVQIFAVACGVLRDDVELAHALFGELLRLADEVLYFSAAEFSANHRDSAEGALVVAALGDFQVSGVKRRGLHSAALKGKAELVGKDLDFISARERLFHDVGDLLVCAYADCRVYFVELFCDLVLITLGKTARHDDRLDFSLALHCSELDDLVDAFLLRGIDKAAGVHDNCVRFGGVADDRKALLPE